MSRGYGMSRYIANIHIYEVLDRTHCHLWVGHWSATNPRTERLYDLTFITPSEGIENPQLWLKALLVECIEAL